MPGIDTLGGIGLASDLFGTALDIKELIEGDQTAVALAEISEKLDELLGLSQDILNAVGATQDLITSTYVSDIQSDVKQALNYLHLYRSTGNAGDAAQAIAKSVEAMSDITTYAVSAPVEQGLLAATMIAAASTRILIINELQDGATSGEFKNELLAARADLEAALPIFEREVLDGIQATPTNIDYGGGGFVPEWADYTYQFTNSAGAAASFVWRLYFNDTDPIFTLGRPATTSEFVGFLYRKGYGDQVETHVDPLLAADLEAYGYADIQEVSAGLEFLTSGAWLRGRDGTVNDVLTSSQAADYLSPDTLDGYRGNDRLTGGRGNDAVRGDEGNDILVGNRGNDTLRGGLGNDVLQGGLGGDRIDGGGGVDRVTYADATRGVVVSLDLSERQNTRMGYDRLASVEHLDGSAHGDVLKGGTGANVLRGLSGGDALDGFFGNDRLEGGGGNDVLMGGSGADLLSGGTGKDWASYSAARAAVTVSLANSRLNLGEAAGDRFASIEGLIGSRFNDRLDGANIVHNSIDGGAGRDSIRGFSGNDVLKGGDGNDTLMGGTGGDRLEGGSGVDTASYAASRTGVKVFLADAASNTGEALGDRFVSVEALIGSAFNDGLVGANNVNNIISGGAGNDRINGYSGNDRLSGGAGDDIFIFDTALNGRTNVDTITDFVRLDDTIRLDNSIFSAFGAAAPGAAIARSAFKDFSVAAPDANDRILYDRASGDLFYDADGSGTAHAAVKFAQVEAGTILSAADFMVI